MSGIRRQESREISTKADEYYAQLNETLLGMIPGESRCFLDVGCAAGENGRSIKERFPGAVVHGIEREPKARALAARHLDQVFDTDLDKGLPSLAPPYDCILCGDILEHLTDPWNALTHLAELLSPGGRILASIPNIRHYKILRDLALRGRFTYRSSGILDSTHLRFFTLREMKALFEQAGLQVDRVKPIFRGGNQFIRIADKLSGGKLEEFRAYQYVLRGERRP